MIKTRYFQGSFSHWMFEPGKPGMRKPRYSEDWTTSMFVSLDEFLLHLDESQGKSESIIELDDYP